MYLSFKSLRITVVNIYLCDYLNNAFVSPGQVWITWTQAQNYLMVFCLLFPLHYAVLWGLCIVPLPKEGFKGCQMKNQMCTQKIYMTQNMVSVIGAQRSTFCGNSGESLLTSSMKERHHGGIKASKPSTEQCFNQKLKAKKISGQQNNQWKPLFLKNHYLHGKLLIILS